MADILQKLLQGTVQATIEADLVEGETAFSHDGEFERLIHRIKNSGGGAIYENILSETWMNKTDSIFKGGTGSGADAIAVDTTDYLLLAATNVQDMMTEIDALVNNFNISGVAFLANTQTFTGINTFSGGFGAQMILESSDTTISAADELFGKIDFQSLDASTNSGGIFASIHAESNAAFDGTATPGMDLKISTALTNGAGLQENASFTAEANLHLKNNLNLGDLRDGFEIAFLGVDSGGGLKIVDDSGSTGPAGNLEISSSLHSVEIRSQSNTNAGIILDGADQKSFFESQVEMDFISSLFKFSDAAFGTTGAMIELISTDTTISASGELFGEISFVSSDTSANSAGTFAQIKAVSNLAFDGGANKGMNLVFSTALTDGAGLQERFQILAEGSAKILNGNSLAFENVAENNTIELKNIGATGVSTLQLGDLARIDETTGRLSLGSLSAPSYQIEAMTQGTNSQAFVKLSSNDGLRFDLSTDASDDSYFYMYDGSGVLKTAFRTDNNPSYIVGGSKFGIGTTTPSSQLTVVGDVLTSGSIKSTQGSTGLIYAFTAESNNPSIGLVETGVSADSGRWFFQANGERLLLNTRTDDGVSGNNIISIERTGTSIDSFSIYAGNTTEIISIDINGQDILSGKTLAFANALGNSNFEIKNTGATGVSELDLTGGNIFINDNVLYLDTKANSYSRLLSDGVGGVELHAEDNMLIKNGANDGLGTIEIFSYENMTLHVDDGELRVKVSGFPGPEGSMILTDGTSLKLENKTENSDFEIINTGATGVSTLQLGDLARIDKTTGKTALGSLTAPTEVLEVTGKIRASAAFNLNGTDGIGAVSGTTYTFGGGGTGDIASMTFRGGILTAVTTVP